VFVSSCEMQFRIPYSASLKDKRAVSRSLLDGIRKKYHTAAAEVDTTDYHQLLTIGVAVVSGDASQAVKMLEAVIRYAENHADADIVWIRRYE